MASPRRLAFRDRFVWQLQQVVSARFDDCDGFEDRYVFPDLTTRVPLVLEVSQQEWTTLYSVVLSGADLLYPYSSQNVENLFLSTVNCPVTQFCAALINCLENDPDTLAALLSLLSENGVTGGIGDPSAPMSPDILGNNLLPAGYVCTDDATFGMALAIVNSLNDATTEVLQAIEILTNPVEIANELGDNVPGLGALTTAGDMAAWIQDSAKEAYDLAWSTTIRDQLACLVWCAINDNCTISFDQIWEIYLSEAGANPPTGVLLTDWLAWLMLLPFTGSLSTVATITLLGLLAIRYGGSFGDFSLGIQSLETVIKLAEDDTSSDWSTLCTDPCETIWCYEFDFTASDGGWAALVFTAGLDCQWIAGVGWKGFYYDDPSPDGKIDMSINISLASTEIIYLEIEFTYLQGIAHDPSSLYMSFWDGAGGREISKTGTEMASWTGTQILNWTGSITATELRAWVRAGWNPLPATPGGIAICTRIKVKGKGTNPFGADNC